MTLRGYTNSRILARLAAQDREEQLQRRQAQQDAANRIAGLSAIDRLTGAALQVPGMLKQQQDIEDAKLLEEALLRADVYAPAPDVIVTGVEPGMGGPLPGQMAREPEPMGDEVESGFDAGIGGPLPGELTPDPGELPENVVFKRDAGRSTQADTAREPGVAAKKRGGVEPITYDVSMDEKEFQDAAMAMAAAQMLPAATAAPEATAEQLAGLSAPAVAPVDQEPRAIDTGAQIISPAITTRRQAARAAAQKAAPPPKTPMKTKFPTADAAYARAIGIAERIAGQEPFMARELQKRAAALRAQPEITANLEALEAAIADAQRVETSPAILPSGIPGLPVPAPVQPRAVPVAEPAPTRPEVGATALYEDKRARIEADAARQKAEAGTPTEQKAVKKYASDIDENIAKTGVQLNPIMQVDAVDAGKEIVKEVMAGAEVEPNSIAGFVQRVLGTGKPSPGTWLKPSPRAIRIAELAAARRIKERQVEARKAAFEEAATRTKLDEQRAGGTLGAKGRGALNVADYGKYRDMERDGAIDAVYGRLGPQLMEAARIPDPAERAKAVGQVLTLDNLPATELVTADEVRGAIIQSIVESGEDFLSARKAAKTKEEKPTLISDTMVKELATVRSSYDQLAITTPSEKAGINRALNLARATGKVGEALTQAFGDAIKNDPTAVAADNRIKRNIAAYLKATSGLAATDAEYKRIWESAPNEGDPPDVYYAKLNDFLAQVANYHDRLLSTAEQSGRSIGRLQLIGTPIQFDIGTGKEMTPAEQSIKKSADKRVQSDAADLE